MGNGSVDSRRGRYTAIGYINFHDLAFVTSVGDFWLVKLSFCSLFGGTTSLQKTKWIVFFR